MSDDEQIAALREEIRQAGRSVRRLRLTVGVCVGLLVIAAMEVMFQIEWAHGRDGRPAFLEHAMMLSATLFLAICCSCLVALPAAAAWGWVRRITLAHRLSGLAPAATVEVLLPLRNAAQPDTAGLVESLLRQFRLPSELAPAPAPDARGDEGSPAEEVT